MVTKKKINLALQGGGSHGAFTWGVLNRLLDEERLEISGISGTSAGAVNATLTASGLLDGGRKKAKELLYRFWQENAEAASYSLFQPTPVDKVLGPGNIDYNPFYHIFSFLSPYQYNPFNINPLEDFIKELVDFETIQNEDSIKLFLSATNIRTSNIKVFQNKEITPEAVSASCALPLFFHAVKIGDDYYWDGGYVGNPALFPLIEKTNCSDLLILQVQCTDHQELPTTPFEIQDRATEISFNTSLMREVRFIHFVNKVIDEGLCDYTKLKRVYLHLIAAREVLREFNISSKANPTWEFVSYLKEEGEEKADEWLKNNFDKIGKENSFDIRQYIG